MAIPAQRAPSHPRRIEILDFLASVDRASDEQIAEAVELEPATAAYHLRVLLDANMVDLLGPSSRGTARRIYATAVSNDSAQ